MNAEGNQILLVMSVCPETRQKERVKMSKVHLCSLIQCVCVCLFVCMCIVLCSWVFWCQLQTIFLLFLYLSSAITDVNSHHPCCTLASCGPHSTDCDVPVILLTMTFTAELQARKWIFSADSEKQAKSTWFPLLLPDILRWLTASLESYLVTQMCFWYFFHFFSCIIPTIFNSSF